MPLTPINDIFKIIDKLEKLLHFRYQIDENGRSQNGRNGQKQRIGEFHQIFGAGNQKSKIAYHIYAVKQKAHQIPFIERIRLHRLMRTHADNLQFNANRFQDMHFGLTLNLWRF